MFDVQTFANGGHRVPTRLDKDSGWLPVSLVVVVGLVAVVVWALFPARSRRW